ncbi:ArsR family transcriptional regulator [Candidatus Woesearchaeota archaeon]|nr:ArsR family transcriptional regulator [Candidatus Woesearchaeota archaeon]
MDMYKVKWTTLQYRILRFLCIKAGQTFNLRGLAKPLKVSPTAVSNSLKDLRSSGLIDVESSKKMNLLSISLNRDNKESIQFKRTENLRMLYESGLSDFLYNEFPGCDIILFGSYSKGYDVLDKTKQFNSDIDIAVIGSKEKEADTAKFDRLLERTINLNFYSSWKGIHKNLKDSILDGITLSGGVES